MRNGLIAGLLLAVACGPTDMDGENADATVARGADTASIGSSQSTAALEAELMRLEREFSAASGREGASAWSSRWAPNGRSYFDGEELVGPEAVGAAVAPMLESAGDRFTWSPDTAVVSESGDLGYTLGRYVIVGEGEQAGDTIGQGHYVTIWQKQEDGSWKIAVDIGT